MFTIMEANNGAIQPPVTRTAYSMPEAARSLGVSLGTVKVLIAQGKLRTVRLGRRVLIPVTVIEAMLAS